MADSPGDAEGRQLIRQRFLLPALAGDSEDAGNTAIAEYLAEGTTAPMLMLKKDRYKYTSCSGDAARLFDVVADPHESENLAGSPEYERVESELQARANGHWDSEGVRAAVIGSQKRRHFTHDALQVGEIRSWDFQPYRDASRQYNRNFAGEMVDTDRRARIPYREPPVPDDSGERDG